MAEVKRDIPINYRLKTIELIEEKLGCLSKTDIEITRYHYRVNVSHKVKLDKKVIIVLVEVFINTNIEDTIFGYIKVACIFEVDNLNSFINPNTQDVKLPSIFESNINSISISTVRGIMFSQFKGTNLHKAILPIIPPSTLRRLKPPSRKKTL